MIQSGAFTELRKTRNTGAAGSEARAVSGPVHFRLRQDDYGWYLATCDRKGNEVRTSGHYYQGSMAIAVSLYNRIADGTGWQIEWGRNRDRIYVDKYPDLMESVLSCSGFLTRDPNDEILQFDPRQGQLVLEIREPEEGLLESRVVFHPCQRAAASDFSFLTSALVLAGNTVYRCEPVVRYRETGLFNSTILRSEVTKLISLFVSVYPEAEISYLDYEVEPVRGKVQLQPTLILESVDAEGALQLSAAVSAEGFDAAFLNSYELLYMAAIDDEQKSVGLNQLVPCDIESAVTEVARTLRRLQDRQDPLGTFHQIDNLFILQPNLALRFLEQELHTVLSDFILLGSRQLEKYHIRMVRPSIDLKVGSGIDFLEGRAEIGVEGERFSLADFFSQYEENRYILLQDGTKAVIERSVISRLKRLLKPDKLGNVKISFFDLPLVASLINEKTAAAGFLRSRRILQGFNDIWTKPLDPPRLEATLRAYQLHGYSWLRYLKSHNLGGCLADDMGLGKTIQTIALLSDSYPGEHLPSLIIMPNSILLNWMRELARFAPQITAVIYHGQGRELEHCLGRNVILTTYATMRNDIKLLKEQEFAFIVLDESQRIKNLDSMISKAVMLLKGKHRLALSGTPIENNLMELYALYRFLNPAMFGKKQEFIRDYYDPIVKNGDTRISDELKLKIYPFMLRRLKSEVLRELPDKIEQVLPVEMSASQAALYDRRRKFYLEEIREAIRTKGVMNARFLVMNAMNELRQIASIPESKSEGEVQSPKIEVLCEYLEETIGNGHKALVFANFLAAVERIVEELEKRDIPVLRMTGSTRNRSAIVDMFQNGDEFKVLVMTLKTGGVGLNLTAADYVFLFDPWWNAAAETQAIDRAHRIGQKNSVFSYKLITQGSIEEKILQLQKNKQELVEALIDSDSSEGEDGVKMLKEEDIDFIFSGSR